MQETLHDHDTSISIGGRPICNLRFVDDIDLMGGSNDELQDFTNKLVDMVTCEMEVSTEKSKIMTNSANNISADISMNGQKVRGGNQLQVPESDPVQRWHLPNRSSHQDCLSNGSNG